MNISEIINYLKGSAIYNNLLGKGKIEDITIKDDNVRVIIAFQSKTSKFALAKIINNDLYEIKSEQKEMMSNLLELVKKPKKNITFPTPEKSAHLTKSVPLRSNVKKNSTSLQILKESSYYQYIKTYASLINQNKMISTQLIDFYDDEGFEDDLLKITFNIIKRDDLIANSFYRAVAVVGLTYISLKYYVNNYHDVLFDLYKKYMNDNMKKQTLENKFKETVSYYRNNKIVDYYFESDTYSSYVAIPICLSCVPESRVFDLYKLSYSIYKKKLLFAEDICDSEMHRKVRNVYFTLKNKDLLGNDDAPIKGTEYLLSKFTQSSIFTGKSFEELIEITCQCMKYLINYLKKDEERYYISPYYRNGFDLWKKYFEKNPYEMEEYKKNRKFSTPIFIFRNRKLILVTAKYNIEEEFGIDNVFVNVYSGSEIEPKLRIRLDGTNDIYFNNDEIGGYILNPKEIEINFDILNNLRYTITANDEIVYDSLEKMYRDNLFFNDYGKEIVPGTEYEGQLTVIHKESIKDKYDVDLEEKINDELLYSFLNVKKNKRYLIDGNYYSFSKEETPRLSGDYYDNIVFKPADSKHTYKIYSTAELLFNSFVDKNLIMISVDDENIPIVDPRFNLVIYRKTYTNEMEYKLDLNWISNGKHTISLFTTDDSYINDISYNFIYDKSFYISTSKISDSIKELEISCSFLENEDKKEKHQLVPGQNVIEINGIFINQLKYGTLFIYSPYVSYSINKADWSFINGPLVYLNIFKNSCLYLCGLNNYTGAYISSIDDKDCNNKQVSCYPSKEDPEIYKLDLNTLGKNFDVMILYFQLGLRREYLQIQYYPDIDVGFNRYGNNNYKLDISTNTKEELKFVLKGQNNKKEYVNFTFNTNKSLDFPSSEIEHMDKNLIAEVYAPEKSLFKIKFAQKPFFSEELTISKFILQGKKIIYDKKSNILKCSLKFKGVNSAKVALIGSSYDYRFKEVCLASGETITFDLNQFYYDYFSISVRKNNLKNKSITIVEDNIINNQKFIGEEFNIVSYIDRTNIQKDICEIMKINQPIKINSEFGYLCTAFYQNEYINFRIIIKEKIENRYLCRVFPDPGILIQLPNGNFIKDIFIERI